MSSAIDPRRLADNWQPDFGMDWVPRLPLERLNQLSDRELREYVEARKLAESFADKNQVGSGWVLPSWRKVLEAWKKWPIQILLGGVRSSKSSLAARICVGALGNIPECEIRAYHVNADRSKQDQQRFIYDALPESLKNMPTARSRNHSTRWTQATGFTNDLLILPPLPGWTKGGRIDFGNYKQYEQDQKVAEGFKAHVIWGDEAMPVKMFETLLYRTTDYHGRIILSFTTLEGWTPLVQDILGKTRTIESRISPHTGKRIPTIQESLSRPGALIHYFWTEDNPFIDGDEFRKKLKGRPIDEVLAYAHGIPTKAAQAVFPLFSRDTNVIKHEDLPFIKKPDYPVTRYFIMDPGGSKSDFLLWVAIDAAGTYFVYRDWPDHATYGAWALPGSTAEGKPGPAQDGRGMGINEEVEIIKQLEAGERIFERLVDPRMGAAEKKGDEGATTIITDFEDHGITLIPAPGLDIKHGLKLINGLLHWKPDLPRDSRNSPKIYFSDQCENSIQMMAEYTATYVTEHTKEAPDLLRYLTTSQPIHVAAGDADAVGSTRSY